MTRRRTTRRQSDQQQRTGDDGLFALLAAAVDLARRDAALDPDRLSDPTDRKRARRYRESARWFLADLGLDQAPAAGDD